TLSPPGPPAQVAWQREGAGHAEEVACCKEDDHGERTPISPRKHTGKVHGTRLRTTHTINDHDDGQQEHRELRAPSACSTPQKLPHDGNSEQIKRKLCADLSHRTFGRGFKHRSRTRTRTRTRTNQRRGR